MSAPARRRKRTYSPAEERGIYLFVHPLTGARWSRQGANCYPVNPETLLALQEARDAGLDRAVCAVLMKRQAIADRFVETYRRELRLGRPALEAAERGAYVVIDDVLRECRAAVSNNPIPTDKPSDS